MGSSTLFGYFKIFTEIRYGIDFENMNFTDNVINSDIPVLLFHGDDDEWVPVEMSDLIAENRDTNFTYIRYENVGHVAWNADADNYVYQLDTFFVRLRLNKNLIKILYFCGCISPAIRF